MHSLEEARSWVKARVDDVYGTRVGEVVDIFFDPNNQEVHWLLVRSGVGDRRLSLVPVHYSIPGRDQVWVPITKDLITRAPEAPAGRGLTREEEIELCFHYGGLRSRATALGQRSEGVVTSVPCASVLPFRQR